MRVPSPLRPDQAIHAVTELNRKVLKGLENLSAIREEDYRVGVTPKEEVYREDNMVLYHYVPVAERPLPVPLLIVYALINRPYMVDIQEDRSLVRALLKMGIDIYLIDWGYPARADRWLTLDDYINGYLDTCVGVVGERHRLKRINLLGICQGGTFSLCYTALHPEKVKNLITMVTPVDFHVEGGLLNQWVRGAPGCKPVDIDRLVDAFGNIPGELMNFSFLMLRPGQLGLRKYVELIDILDDKDKLLSFLRMEKWIFDSPDQAGEAFRQFVKDFYQDNKLIKREAHIGEKRVDLHRVSMPVLNIYARQDHLVPPASSLALQRYVGTTDYTVLAFPVGHIGIYVSSKVRHDLPPAIATWLRDRG